MACGGTFVNHLGFISPVHNWTQTGKGADIRTLCQKNKGSVKIKQKPTKIDTRTIHRTLSSKGTPFQIGIDA
jgi:hypothetical protein